MSSKSNILEVKNLYMKYNKKDSSYSLDNLNFCIEEGDFHAFIGENGAGKSTTIKVISGLNNDYDGEVLINGLNTKEDIESRKSFSYVPDKITDNLSFLDNMVGSFLQIFINNSNLDMNEIYTTDANNINFWSSNANLTIDKNKIINDIINMNNMVLSLTYNDYPIFEFDMLPNEERQINLKKENENDFRLNLINVLINHISSANIKNISNSVLSQNVYNANNHQIVKIKNHFIEFQVMCLNMFLH